MERCKILWVSVLLILSSLAFAQGETDKVDQYIQDQLLNNVVIVEGMRNDGRPITGLGMIVGRSADAVWIATAKHVVFVEDQLLSSARVSPVKFLRAKFRDGRAWELAHPPMKTMIDLAFFSVNVPFGQAGPDLWRENVETLEPAVGTIVRLAGMPGVITYGASQARIAGTDVQGNVAIDNLVGAEGQSGAPVATSDGFVGIYVQSAGSRVIPMSSIKREAALAGTPYMLLPAPRKGSAVQLCLINESSAPSLPSVSDTREARRPDKDGCVTTTSGPNRLVSPDIWTRCRPQLVELSTQAKQSLRVTCSLTPSGIWRAKEDGYVEVKEADDALWVIEGFTSRFGTFDGALRGTSTSLAIELRMSSGLSLHGQIELSSRSMRGHLSGTAGTWQLELAR